MRHDWQHPGWQQHREAAAGWGRVLREVLQRDLPGIDSPAQAEAYVVQLRASCPERQAYDRWQAVADSVQAAGVPVWVSTEWVSKIAKYAEYLECQRNSAVLVWCESPALREELGRQGLHVVGLDEDPPQQRTCVLSRRAHGVGLNLQRYNTCLVAEQPTDAGAWEQLLARVHRVGQLADDVLFVVPYWHGSVLRRFSETREQARFIQETTSQTQKLLLASYDLDLTQSEDD